MASRDWKGLKGSILIIDDELVPKNTPGEVPAFISDVT
jgi:hypothetical protein